MSDYNTSKLGKQKNRGVSEINQNMSERRQNLRKIHASKSMKEVCEIMKNDEELNDLAKEKAFLTE
jgi:hypothetical protein